MSERKAKLQYVIAVLLYGTIGMLLRQIQAPSELVVLCRGVIGTITILTILTCKGRKLNWKAIRENGKMLVISGICLGLNWVLLFAAYRVTTVAIASLCNYMAPIIVVLLAPMFFGDKLTGKKLLCVAAAFCGIVLVSGVVEGGMEGVNKTGVALGLSAAVCFVIIVLCNRKIHGVDALEKSAVQLSVSALTVLPYVIWANGGIPFPHDGLSIFLILVLGVVHTGLAYIFYFGSLGSIPVQSVALLGYLEPVVSVLTSALILKEAMTPFGIVGACLIIAAAAASELIS